jgi:hypothetical protein
MCIDIELSGHVDKSRGVQVNVALERERIYIYGMVDTVYALLKFYCMSTPIATHERRGHLLYHVIAGTG